MSESKSEMSAPVGNLKNRIDNNLKLSIPNTNVNINGVRNQPSTAPAVTGMKNQFSDLPMMKSLMKNWDQDSGINSIGDDDYFVTTPGSIISTSSLSRKKQLKPLNCLSFITLIHRTFTSNVTVYGCVDSVWTQSDKIYEVESDSARARGESHGSLWL